MSTVLRCGSTSWWRVVNIAICPMKLSFGQESLTWRKMVGEDAVLGTLEKKGVP